jgi:hypothetical protein
MTHIWQGLRSGRGLTAERARGYSLILLGGYVIAIAGWIALSDGRSIATASRCSDRAAACLLALYVLTLRRAALDRIGIMAGARGIARA